MYKAPANEKKHTFQQKPVTVFYVRQCTFNYFKAQESVT